MNKLIVFSSQPEKKLPSKKKLTSISIKEIEFETKKVVLVVVKEKEREYMEKIEKKYGFKTPIDLTDYITKIQKSHDKEYVLKEKFVSSFLKRLGRMNLRGEIRRLVPAW